MKTVLFIFISFIALTALISGLILATNTDGDLMNLSLSLLDITPFKDFKIPGLLLAIIVGGVNLIAVFLNIQRHQNRYNWAMAGGIILIAWIIIQIILIGVFHWLHALYLVLGILVTLIAYQLKGKWAV